MASEVTFKVVGITKARKHGNIVINVSFNNSNKVYTYVRAARDSKNGKCVIIDGCEVNFNDDMVVTSINRIYETAGVKKTKAGKVDKNKNNTVTSEATTKDENESEGIDTKETNEEETEATSEVANDEANETNEMDNDDGIVRHEEYETIKQCLLANVPVYLAGPAGSGKNYTVEQVAWDLGWDFCFSNSVQQEYKLTGFIDAGGKFHETEFYKACTSDKDCVFFLDEMDASIPEVLVLLNAAIANGYFEFPNGKVTLEHVHFVAAGNTVGSGSDELYTGRMVLDQATLDRFVIIEFDYSKKIELSIAKGDHELVEFVHELRESAKERGIRATFSYRCIKDVVALSGKLELKKIIKIAVVKGMDKDTINTLSIDCDNKYGRAYKEVQRMAA